jgi:hypothetical protein
VGIQAFQQSGNTVTFTAAASPPAPVQVPLTSPGSQYLITNAGTTIVFLGYGATSAQATSNSATVTSTGPALVLLPGTSQPFTLGANLWFTGTSSSSAAVYITPGDGV